MILLPVLTLFLLLLPTAITARSALTAALAALPSDIHPSVRRAVEQLGKLASSGKIAETSHIYGRKNGAPFEYLGVRARPVFSIAREVVKERRYSTSDALAVMDLPFYEYRRLALHLLENRLLESREWINKLGHYRDSSEFKSLTVQRQRLVNDLVSRLSTHLPNYGLIDIGAPILGEYVSEDVTARKSILTRLRKSESLWDRRASVVATYPLIKNKKREGYQLFEELAVPLLRDSEKLVYSSVGWMIRQGTKIDREYFVGFLRAHASRFRRRLLCATVSRLPRALQEEIVALKGTST